jgi:dienelactone hydrolase
MPFNSAREKVFCFFFSKKKFFLTLLCLSLTAAEDPPNPALIPPAPLHEQVLQLPGDPDRPVSLQVTLYTPEGPGPFPLAVMNHGSSGNAQARKQMPRYRFTMSAYYFLSRGYAVALPMMRGFAGSGGEQNRYGCNLTQLAEDNARDILAVIKDLADNPQTARLIDASRVVVAGQSFGGWNTLGVGALQPRNIRGLINFVGGVQSSACNEIEDDGEALARAAGNFGNYTLQPSIWFYGENDSLFGPKIWQPMHQAYVSHNANAELVNIGSFMNDSHQMLSRPESLPLWAPKLDAFLSRIGMPGRPVQPAYLPIAWPKPTHFADVGDAAAIPWISDQGRQNYHSFLQQSSPRVFEISITGQSAATHGGFDPLARANELCQKNHLLCVPYAIDNDVVFQPPPPVARPATTHFAPLDGVEAVPWINEKGRDTYRAFLAHKLPRAFVIGEGGQSLAIYTPPAPLAAAMATCTAAHIICHPYAVDTDVVFVRPPTPPKPPRPSHFASLTDTNAIPWANAHGRENYAHFLTVSPPRAFVIARGGQTVAAQGGYDPFGRALRICQAAGFVCRPYAVDYDVVWVPPK